ncbi:hypothetical protein VTI74DRAFT_5616 [Chaetomium olivicolor]
MEIEYDMVSLDEFDAVAIEPRDPSPQQTLKDETPASSSPSSTHEKKAKHQANFAWLHKDMGKFPAKTHARKVANELGVKNGVIYLPGQVEELYEDSDMGPEFRQRRYFYYMSGADFPGCAVTYDISRDQLILWIPFTDPRTVLWYGRTPSQQECKAISDVDDVRFIRGLTKLLLAALSQDTPLFCLHQDQIPKLENPSGSVHIDTNLLAPAIERARVIKTEYEIAMIRRANAVSSAAHKAVMSRIKHLSNEREIDAIFRCFCIAQGAKHQAYPIIAASGTNGSTLHYNDNNQRLAGRQLVVLDAGAEWNCYASDITRTFPISGSFSREAAAIYRIVERMQTECIERIRPGTAFHILHLHACTVAVLELLKLGILHGGTPSEILANGTIAAFFPHGLGHHVGLEVHDVSGTDRLLIGLEAQSLLKTASPWKVRPGRTGLKRELFGAPMLAGMYRDAVFMMHQQGQQGQAQTQLPAQGQEGQSPAQVLGEQRPQFRGPILTGKQVLRKGMVVTVEPGIYFCREYLEGYFLEHPVHSKYINTKELEKYWDVGGVRIEDDILVTEDGHENLTTAPKGKEMLRVINEEADN